MIYTGNNSIITAPSIDDIGNPILTPSLVAYYKCNEGRGEVIYDYSGNDNHMQFGNGIERGFDDTHIYTPTYPKTVNDLWDRRADYVTPLSGYGFFIKTAGTKLDTGSKFVIWCAELCIADSTSITNDMDYGWYWAGQRNPEPLPDNFPHPHGMNIGQVGDQHWMRMAWADANPDTDQLGTPDPVHATLAQYHYAYSGLVYTHDFGNKQWSIAGAFIPSVEMRTIATHDDGNPVSGEIIRRITATGTATFPATMGSQGGIFGIRGQTNYSNASSVRNIQVWAFDSEPQFLNEAMVYMTRNHGAIPYWWIGK